MIYQMDNYFGRLKSDVLLLLDGKEPRHYKKNDLIGTLNDEQKAYYNKYVNTIDEVQEKLFEEETTNEMNKILAKKVGAKNG